jgi:hypothetical protein
MMIITIIIVVVVITVLVLEFGPNVVGAAAVAIL